MSESDSGSYPPSVQAIAKLMMDQIPSAAPASRAVVLNHAKRIQKNWRKGAKPALRDFKAIPGPKRPVINGTGILLHTNLGRAPLGENVLKRVSRTLSGYADLELDLFGGGRGGRTAYLDALFSAMNPRYEPVWVNNNAAALLLALNTLKKTTGLGRLIISRGELVEIGGGFRVPEIMGESGFELVEVGTTNKTRLIDYERALKKNPAVVCCVHPSNFTMEGFTESVAPAELVPLCRRFRVPLIYDAGTLSGDELRRLPPGFACVTLSTDKTLGGIQGGLIAARKSLRAEILKNPFYRAMRLDKVSIVALEAVLEAHAEKQDRLLIPYQELLHRTPDDIKTFAEKFLQDSYENFSLEMTPCDSSSGGGSLPGQVLPSFGLALEAKNSVLNGQKMDDRALECLRRGQPAVLTTIVRSRLVVNLRTVFQWQEKDLKTALKRLDDCWPGQ